MATLKIEGIAKLNKGLKKRMDMSAVRQLYGKTGQICKQNRREMRRLILEH